MFISVVTLDLVSVFFWASYIFSPQTRVSFYLVPELITWVKSKVGPNRNSPQNSRYKNVVYHMFLLVNLILHLAV